MILQLQKAKRKPDFPIQEQSAALQAGTATVIDKGGGSTEIISGKYDGILFSSSYQLGVVSLTERFFNNQPPEQAEIKLFTDFVKETISGIDIAKITASKTIAIAGTPTTLACIKQNLSDYDETLIEGSTLTKEELALTDMLSKLTPIEIKTKYGNIVAGREDVILAGTAILHCTMQC